MSEFLIRQAVEQDVNRCFDIEQSAYEGDEAASRENILTRIREYPEGFIVLEHNNEIVGFINCGATNNLDLANEEFKGLVCHDPLGKCIVIFSVVVHTDYQGKGFAGILITDFISKMRAMNKESIHFICRTHHVDFYKKYGFKYIGESESSHGGLTWHDMEIQLNNDN